MPNNAERREEVPQIKFFLQKFPVSPPLAGPGRRAGRRKDEIKGPTSVEFGEPKKWVVKVRRRKGKAPLNQL